MILDMGRHSVCQAVQTIQGPPGEEKKKGKGKGQGKGKSKRTGRAFFGDEQAQDSEWWSEKTLLGGLKERKAVMDCQKAIMAFIKVGFRPHQPDKGAGKDYTQNQGKGKDQKRKR